MKPTKPTKTDIEVVMDVDEHRQLKARTALAGQTITDYVLDLIRKDAKEAGEVKIQKK